MTWPYHFVDLSPQEKHDRRILLDRYGVFAQLSALIPILTYLLFRLGRWVNSERKRASEKVDYSAVPSSPKVKYERSSGSGLVGKEWRKVAWWLEEEVLDGWGERRHWIAFGGWFCWLLFLSVHRTGDDYLHITKRFGEVAVSQIPMHYMLSMKSIYSPLALVFNTSHEQLNPWHRLSGRVIYTLLILHASWYLNFFIQSGILVKRLTSLDVIIGITAFTALTTIATTSLATVRRWSYRVFFVLHLFIGVSILPLLYFHAEHLRLYVIEAFVLFLIDVVCRKLDTTTGFATITAIPHSKLIRIKIPVPSTKLKRFHAAPGQHVYLSIPSESTPPSTATPSIYDLLFNPFTVAEVTAKDIILILRTLRGPTTQALDTLSQLPKAKPPINIEGPLGSSVNFPNLAAEYDRVLLVAGGVGATFILPIYRHLQEQLESESRSPDRISFVWSMRSASEASWALDPTARARIDDEENVRLFITRNSSDNISQGEPIDGSVEMENLDRKEDVVKASGGRDRPDLREIVDEVFRKGNEESIAVLVCGPKAMARGVRREVGKWVGRGRDVFFHDESFGL